MEEINGNGPEDQFKEDLESFDDNEIIKRIIQGEKQLYALIIRKYNQRLYRVGLSILNNESEVEEVMQLTYIKAYENLEKFRSQASFSTWLTKILVNESLMQVRKKERDSKRQQEKSFEFESAVDLQTPLMKILNSELKKILETSIRELPEKYRTVFVMREMENMSVSETMECLDLSESNVKVRLNRAKVILREKLRQYLKDDEILKLYNEHCDKMVDDVMRKIK